MLKHYIGDLLTYSGAKAVLSITLFFFQGLTQGAGLVMIIPLLQTLGLPGNGSGGSVSGVTRFISNALIGLGLPVNIYSLLAVYIVIVSLLAVIKRFQAVLTMTIQQGYVHHLRNRVYAALTYAEWSFTLRRKSSDITHVVTTDIQRVGSGTHFFLQLLSETALVLFHIIAALFLSIPLTAATLIFGGVMMLLMKPLNRKAQDTGLAFRSSRKALFGAVMEHLAGMKTAKSCGVEELHIEKMKEINRGIETQVVAFTGLRARTKMYYDIASVMALSVYFGAALTIKAVQVPITELLVLVFIFARLMPQFSSMAQGIQNIRNMLPSFEGVTRLHKDAEAAREGSPQTAGKPLRINVGIDFQHIWFRYSSECKEAALQDATFHIPAYDMTAITGASGAGKSTAADLLLGLLKPEQGRIVVDGAEIHGNDLFAWRRTIGYVPQETFLFHDTVRENMLWAMPSASEEDLWRALDMAAAGDFVRGLPAGLDTMLGDRGITVSGGERQRLALARALLRQPQLLLLDEATSALDSDNEQLIFQALRRLKGKLTILVIAHRPSTLQYADHIIRLDKGRVTNPPHPDGP